MLCGWEGLTLHWPCETNDSDMPIYGLTAFEQVLHFSIEYRPLYRCTSDCIRGLHGSWNIPQPHLYPHFFYPTTPSQTRVQSSSVFVIYFCSLTSDKCKQLHQHNGADRDERLGNHTPGVNTNQQPLVVKDMAGRPNRCDISLQCFDTVRWLTRTGRPSSL